MWTHRAGGQSRSLTVAARHTPFLRRINVEPARGCCGSACFRKRYSIVLTPRRINSAYRWRMDRARMYHASTGMVPRFTDLPLRCPCCGCKTLSERGGFEICQVCFWEDDGQDDSDAADVRGGPNGALSLTQARTNYLRFGACDSKFIANVRRPRSEELAG